MGLRAACFEKRGGVPADEPPHLTVGGERAPLPRMRPSPRPEPLVCVCVCVCVCARVCVCMNAHTHMYVPKVLLLKSNGRDVAPTGKGRRLGPTWTQTCGKPETRQLE